MKTIIITLLATLSFISCKAQSPIIPLYKGAEYGETQNAYYKDTNNDFDKFVGTWLYTNPNNNEQFKIVLKKNEQNHVTYTYNNNVTSFFEDDLVGEYQYIDAQGNEINSLVNINNEIVISHLIYGNDIINNTMYPHCENCLPNERRVFLTLKDPGRSHFDYNIVIRHTADLITGEKIIIKIDVEEMNIMVEGLQNDDRLPFIEFTLIKQ